MKTRKKSATKASTVTVLRPSVHKYVIFSRWDRRIYFWFKANKKKVLFWAVTRDMNISIQYTLLLDCPSVGLLNGTDTFQSLHLYRLFFFFFDLLLVLSPDSQVKSKRDEPGSPWSHDFQLWPVSARWSPFKLISFFFLSLRSIFITKRRCLYKLATGKRISSRLSHSGVKTSISPWVFSFPW